MSKYEYIGIIGHGGYGRVYAARRVRDKKPVAIKVTKQKTELKEGFLDEVSALKKLHHVHNVIRLYDHEETSHLMFLEFERDERMIDLYYFINETNGLKEPITKQIFIDLVRTVSDLREAKILHGDIKDENILIHRDTLAIKLIDFGAAMEYVDDRFYTDFDGTSVYAPPEWLTVKQYTAHGLNAWSLGCVLYSMLKGNIPFHYPAETISGKYNATNISAQANDLISSCFSPTSTNRPDTVAILEHPFCAQ
jgi:serine/threonine protein kinase